MPSMMMVDSPDPDPGACRSSTTAALRDVRPATPRGAVLESAPNASGA